MTTLKQNNEEEVEKLKTKLKDYEEKIKEKNELEAQHAVKKYQVTLKKV